ncbi:hypothetical protein BGZ95_003423 [Linnemannia exigua]|uniref:Uncharacterized protein n=1 Tax=Linnemannia exigua TaxID=604196 RepID=A0AAD4D602_9FUNG|nr:hypothetical protein BGZ95_003423 [Linnemannia exigua]
MSQPTTDLSGGSLSKRSVATKSQNQRPDLCLQDLGRKSLEGLYKRLILRARELKTFEASSAAQDDPWTPTKLSVTAMELLDLHDQVHERHTRIMEARALLDEEFIAEGPSENQILVHPEQSERGEGAYQEQKEKEVEAAATIVNDSGPRDDLWEVVTVQARTFQELTDEVVQLREEAAGLRDEVAQLRRKDVRREFEMASKFRAVEDKLVFIQEEVLKLKMMDGREP